GWPVLGIDGKVPDSLNLPASIGLIPGIVSSDEFNRKKKLPLGWTWNHNPDNSLWSLTKRKGYLRLTTGRIDSSFLLSRNILTQRTIGPTCTGTTSLDLSNMKDGDFAGLCLLQRNYGLIGVRMSAGEKYIIAIAADNGKPDVIRTERFSGNTIYFKIECDFTNKKDIADFYYSNDDKTWEQMGIRLHMIYTLPHFMGYRFGLFNYASKNVGGFVDFDFFRIENQITNKE